jgi:hypothetical protein
VNEEEKMIERRFFCVVILAVCLFMAAPIILSCWGLVEMGSRSPMISLFPLDISKNLADKV